VSGIRERVSRVETGAFAARCRVPRGDRLVFLLYGATGYDVHELELPAFDAAICEHHGLRPRRPRRWPPPYNAARRGRERARARYNPLWTRVAAAHRAHLARVAADRVLERRRTVGTGQDAAEQHDWRVAFDYNIESGRLSEALSLHEPADARGPRVHHQPLRA
jgi:hypothetical protein